MDNASIFARIASGFAVRVAAAILVVYAASEAWSFVSGVFAHVGAAL